MQARLFMDYRFIKWYQRPIRGSCGHDHIEIQLPVHSVPITTHVMRLNPDHGKVYLIKHNVIKFVSDLQQVGGFLRVRYN